MPNPQTTAEMMVGNSGFLSLLEVLPTLKGQLLRRLKVALLERSHNALFLKKLPFIECLPLFSNSFFEESQSQ